jgi:quercetin dioxygenase-like cupin family protein
MRRHGAVMARHGAVGSPSTRAPARGATHQSYHLIIKNMSPKVIAMDTGALPWEERFNAQVGRPLFRKNLITDPDTGMEVRLVRYPAGFINPHHTHPCAHGMYVLEGILVTHEGNYGPGCFVWSPEGSIMEHGATMASDVTVLFVTNKRFEIHYQG